jgi:hypothetical protein
LGIHKLKFLCSELSTGVSVLDMPEWRKDKVLLLCLAEFVVNELAKQDRKSILVL